MKAAPEKVHLEILDQIVAEEIKNIEEEQEINLWTLNVIYYTIAVTLMENEGKTEEEQAAGKRGSWGCTDQLLANKMIYNETKQKRLNLLTVWLDYKKAFDSVPHSWVIKSLKLAKVPKLIIETIKSLMDKWRAKCTCTEKHQRLRQE